MADKKKKKIATGVKRLATKAIGKAKERVKKELSPKSLKKKVIDYIAGDIKDRVTDASRAKDTANKSPRIGGSRKLAPTVSAGGTFEVKGDKKKRKQLSKIAKWKAGEKKKKKNSKASARAAFFALDAKNKKK